MSSPTPDRGATSNDASPDAPGRTDGVRHILVLANETVAGKTLLDAVRKRAERDPIRVTLICPQNAPRTGLVVYAESRRSAAERRLERTARLLREAGIEVQGAVVDPDPLAALRDALEEHRPDEVIISTHPELRSGWLRGNLIDRARKVAGGVPVEHVVVDLTAPRERAHVLVLANQMLVGEPLLAALKERAEASPADFTLVAPADVPGVEQRLAKALAELRRAGVEATGHIGESDPVCAALNAIHDEQVDEIVISTLPRQRSGWLRRDLVARVQKESELPVRHVVVEPTTEAVAS